MIKKIILFLIISFIFVGTVNADTLTVYCDPSSDGYFVISSANRTYSYLRDDVKTFSTVATGYPLYLLETRTLATTGTGLFHEVSRGVFSANTSVPGAVTNASFTFYVAAKQNTMGSIHTINFTSGYPANPAAIANADNQSWTQTVISTTKQYAEVSASGNTTWYITPSYINTAGYTTIFSRGDDDYNNAFDGVWTSNVLDRIYGYSSEDATRKPFFTIEYTPPPAANFTYNATSGCSPLDIQFTDTSTNSPDNWDWYTDATEEKTSDLQNPVITFSTPGTYSIRLWSSNAGGGSWKNESNLITAIDCSPPTANFTADNTTVCINQNIQFNDTSTSPTAITGWAWDFGDSNISATQNATHAYGYAGLFTVIMSAQNAYGSDAETKTDYITVNDCSVPSVDFTYNATCGVGNLSVLFNDTSSNALDWYWDFGDGNTSTTRNISHLYEYPGIFSVYHYGNNSYGTTWENKTDIITVALNGTLCSATACTPTTATTGSPRTSTALVFGMAGAIAIGMIVLGSRRKQ